MQSNTFKNLLWFYEVVNSFSSQMIFMLRDLRPFKSRGINYAPAKSRWVLDEGYFGWFAYN